MGQQNNTLAIIAIVIIAVLVFGGSLINAASNAYADFWSDFWSMFDQNGDGNGDIDNSALLMCGITTRYTDGTERTVEPTDFQIFPLTVYDPSGGKEVSEWIVSVNVKTKYTGDLTSWKCEGTLTVTVDDDIREKTLLTVQTITISDSGTPDSDATRTVKQHSVSASTVETAIRGTVVYGVVFTVGFHVDVTVTTVIDGLSESLSGTGAGWANILYDADGLKAMSVTVQTTTIHKP